MLRGCMIWFFLVVKPQGADWAGCKKAATFPQSSSRQGSDREIQMCHSITGAARQTTRPMQRGWLPGAHLCRMPMPRPCRRAEQQRDRGLMEAGPSFKNGVLRIKKNSVKKEKKIPYKMRLPSF